MAGYWAGKNIAHTFLGLIRDHDPKQAIDEISEYLKTQDDPRLTEIMYRLEEIFLGGPSLQTLRSSQKSGDF
jgi:hypothetical protein